MKLETEACKESDINLDGDENQDAYKFYQPAEESEKDTRRFYHKLQCIKEDILLKGDYNSA